MSHKKAQINEPQKAQKGTEDFFSSVLCFLCLLVAKN